jgi:hypothetical protein
MREDGFGLVSLAPTTVIISHSENRSILALCTVDRPCWKGLLPFRIHIAAPPPKLYNSFEENWNINRVPWAEATSSH